MTALVLLAVGWIGMGLSFGEPGVPPEIVSEDNTNLCCNLLGQWQVGEEVVYFFSEGIIAGVDSSQNLLVGRYRFLTGLEVYLMIEWNGGGGTRIFKIGGCSSQEFEFFDIATKRLIVLKRLPSDAPGAEERKEEEESK